MAGIVDRGGNGVFCAFLWRAGYVSFVSVYFESTRWHRLRERQPMWRVRVWRTESNSREHSLCSLCMFRHLLTPASSMSFPACRLRPFLSTKPSIRPYANIRPKSNMSKPAKQNQKSPDGGRRGGGKGGTKLGVLREDPPEVRLSKTVTWILRHGAKSEGIFMRPDGAVRVSDLVSLLSSSRHLSSFSYEDKDRDECCS